MIPSAISDVVLNVSPTVEGNLSGVVIENGAGDLTGCALTCCVSGDEPPLKVLAGLETVVVDVAMILII